MNELILPIRSKIFIISGKQVMLDRDLAELYQVESRALNQAVKINSDRFPDDFIFQLTKEELAKKIIELERKNDKQFKEVFKILDGLVEETKNVDEKVMGFLSKK